MYVISVIDLANTYQVVDFIVLRKAFGSTNYCKARML